MSYASSSTSASSEYALRYWGFGANVEIGGGLNYRRVRFGVLVGVDMTPLQEVGSGAEGAGIVVDDHTTEREVYSAFGEYRFVRWPWVVGGSLGWTRLMVDNCCVEVVGLQQSQRGGDNVTAWGPALTVWTGREWRFGDHWAGHALFRMSGMTSDIKFLDAVLGGQDRTTVSLVSGVMLGVALN
jgi:hypothetical protein